MAIELCWLASPAASSLHAAQAILDGRQLADQKIGEALAEPARALRRELAAWEIEPRSFFAHAIPLTVPNDSSEKLAEAVVARLIGQSATSIIISGVARRVAALQAAFNETHPQATTELSLRAGPLAEQWEARGPGLIAAIGRATDKALLAERADVILLQPILGGDGTVFPLYGAVAIEAVLANPIAELPEVVRLGWLLAQLNRRQTPFQPTEPCAQDVLSMIMGRRACRAGETESRNDRRCNPLVDANLCRRTENVCRNSRQGNRVDSRSTDGLVDSLSVNLGFMERSARGPKTENPRDPK
jgi:hypothetical protein